jgi:hypothetical protein
MHYHFFYCMISDNNDEKTHKKNHLKTDGLFKIKQNYKSIIFS